MSRVSLGTDKITPNEQELLTDLLSKLSRLKEEGYWRKIRLILIAREGTSPSIYNSHQKDFPKWYMDIVHDDWAINDHLFLNEFIDLCGLTIEDCTSLHIAYVLAGTFCGLRKVPHNDLHAFLDLQELVG